MFGRIKEKVPSKYKYLAGKIVRIEDCIEDKNYPEGDDRRFHYIIQFEIEDLEVSATIPTEIIDVDIFPLTEINLSSFTKINRIIESITREFERFKINILNKDKEEIFDCAAEILFYTDVFMNLTNEEFFMRNYTKEMAGDIFEFTSTQGDVLLDYMWAFSMKFAYTDTSEVALLELLEAVLESIKE